MPLPNPHKEIAKKIMGMRRAKRFSPSTSNNDAFIVLSKIMEDGHTIMMGNFRNCPEGNEWKYRAIVHHKSRLPTKEVEASDLLSLTMMICFAVIDLDKEANKGMKP